MRIYAAGSSRANYSPNVAAVAVQSINTDIRAVGAVLKAREQEEMTERLAELETLLEARGAPWGLGTS